MGRNRGSTTLSFTHKTYTHMSASRRFDPILKCKNGCGMTFDRKAAKKNKKLSHQFYNHERVSCPKLPRYLCILCSKRNPRVIKGILKFRQHQKTVTHLRALKAASKQTPDKMELQATMSMVLSKLGW